jgi:pyruvate dehydrogenase E1 component alpha subunit
MDGLELYTRMVRIRVFEERTAEILEKNPGEIVCPVHLYVGQEAVAVGVCAALNDGDVVYSNHRSHGHYLAKGGDMKELAAELYCRQSGCSGGKGGSMHLCSPEKGFPGSSAIVAGTISTAVGSALAFKTMGTNNVAGTFFGDGAVNEGGFYEALNLAALRKLPVIFVCENNGFSTHMPIRSCLANTDIIAKAEAMGVPARRIDGNDVVTVNREAAAVVEDIRGGGGPRFLECMTYRWRGHVGPKFDLDKGLRNREELESWMEKGPIRRMENRLKLSADEKSSIWKKVNEEVEDALESAKKGPVAEPGEVWI